MNYEKFEMSLIIPFYYQKSCFPDMDNSINSTFAEDIEHYIPNINVLNEYAESLCTINNNLLFKCVKLTSKGRKKIGIHSNENCVYYMQKNQDISFSIGKVLVWFHPNGSAFLSLQINAKSLLDVQILKLKKSLVNIREKNQYVQYIKPEIQKKANLQPQKVIVKNVIREFFHLIQPLFPIEQNATYREAYALTMGFVPTIDEQFSNHLEQFRRNKSLETNVSFEMHDKFYFIPEDFPYLHWTMADKLLSVTIDSSMAKEIDVKNTAFLQGQFVYSVFHNYLMLYLFYMKLRNNYNDIEIQYAKAKRQLGLFPSKQQLQELTVSLKALTDYEHINCLFMQYLCKNTWKLKEHLQNFKEIFTATIEASEQYDIFISYRRKYGGYVAKHIFTELRNKGYNPFFDLNSMRCGAFDKQIEEKILKSQFVIAVLTPQSLDRCKINEEDWMYKELCYALEYKKKIITVLVDEFECPKDVPEKIEEINRQHGIKMTIEHLDSALNEIVALLEKK